MENLILLLIVVVTFSIGLIYIGSLLFFVVKFPIKKSKKLNFTEKEEQNLKDREQICDKQNNQITDVVAETNCNVKIKEPKENYIDFEFNSKLTKGE